MVHKRWILIGIILLAALPSAWAFDATDENTLSLAGTWAFRLDPNDSGVDENWFSHVLEDAIKLPGTTDENFKGIKKDEYHEGRLSRVFYWNGPAWYQRRVTIPESWKNKRVTLFLERTKNVRVWVDDQDCGSDDSLSAPQIYDLTDAMTPGSHVLTILVDNAKLPPVGPAHAVDERTQTNWNGIIGRIELRATDSLWLDEIQVYPDIVQKKAILKVTIQNRTKWLGMADLKLRATSWNTPAPLEFKEKIQPVRIESSPAPFEVVYDFEEEVPLWSEFEPAMIRLSVVMEANLGRCWLRDSKTIDFGMREFATRRNQFIINGTPVFLRGKNDACIFPLTGYPPMDKAGWVRVLDRSKSSQELPALFIEQGRVFEADMISFPLAEVEAPQRLTIRISIKDTQFVNHYSIWIYPPEVDTSVPQGAKIIHKLDPSNLTELEQGERVLLFPDITKLKNSIKGSFQTDFWCFPMFRRAAQQRNIEVAPGTLGILCDPNTPALAHFPTEFHSNWQWWHLVKNSRPIILDNTPADYRPTVQVIDNFERNHKLGLIFEARVGKGKLLVCAIDLLGHQDKPEARQLLHSLLQYVGSDKFRPQSEIPVKLLEEIFSE